MAEPSKPDFTAWFVMQGLIATMHQPEFQNPENDATLALCKPLSLEASKTRLMSRFIHTLPYSWQYRIGDLTTNSGRLRHFYLRKKEIEKQVRRILAESGIRQVVVLGAGLDVLSVRLARVYPTTRFIEIDRHESQAFKTSAFAIHGIAMPDNVDFIDGDLRNPLADILTQSKAYDATAQTLWIAEGLLMFIPEESVVRILKETTQNSAAGSHIIFTTLPTLKQTSTPAYLLQWFYLQKEKCPYQWALNFDKMLYFIDNIGYRITHQLDYAALHKDFIASNTNNNPPIGENIHIAITKNI